MPINFKCSKCGKPIAVPDKMAGRTGKCPACQSPLTVPTSAASAAAKKAPTGAVPASALKTQLALDADPRVATALGKTKKPAAKASAKKRELDSDGDQTIIDDGMLAAKRSAMHEPETYEVPPLVDDDDDDAVGDEGFPDVPDVIDDDDDEDDGDDGAAGVPSAQEVLERARAKAAQRREDGDGGGGGGARNRRFEPTAGQKKGGGFLWVVFGLLLAISHTAAAAIFGVWLAAAYMKTPAEYAFMAPVIEILGLNDTIAPKTTATPTASPESNTGPPSESETE